jgi:hypothetical protein
MREHPCRVLLIVWVVVWVRLRPRVLLRSYLVLGRLWGAGFYRRGCRNPEGSLVGRDVVASNLRSFTWHWQYSAMSLKLLVWISLLLNLQFSARLRVLSVKYDLVIVLRLSSRVKILLWSVFGSNLLCVCVFLQNVGEVVHGPLILTRCCGWSRCHFAICWGIAILTSRC